MRQLSEGSFCLSFHIWVAIIHINNILKISLSSIIQRTTVEDLPYCDRDEYICVNAIISRESQDILRTSTSIINCGPSIHEKQMKKLLSSIFLTTFKNKHYMKLMIFFVLFITIILSTNTIFCPVGLMT